MLGRLFFFFFFLCFLSVFFFFFGGGGGRISVFPSVFVFRLRLLVLLECGVVHEGSECVDV